jgi:hypothetical protein
MAVRIIHKDLEGKKFNKEIKYRKLINRKRKLKNEKKRMQSSNRTNQRH